MYICISVYMCINMNADFSQSAHKAVYSLVTNNCGVELKLVNSEFDLFTLKSVDI